MSTLLFFNDDLFGLSALLSFLLETLESMGFVSDVVASTAVFSMDEYEIEGSAMSPNPFLSPFILLLFHSSRVVSKFLFSFSQL